jgi:assimilatory nitrate reductase electron transfer subunit
VHDGAASVEEVARATRATTGCGGCTDDVCDLLRSLGASHEADATGENRFTEEKQMVHSIETAAG